MDRSAPRVSLLSDHLGSSLAAKIASMLLRRGLHDAECPCFRQGCHVPRAQSLRGGKRVSFVDLSVSLKDLQGLARHIESLNEDTDPWPSFPPKDSLHGSGSASH